MGKSRMLAGTDDLRSRRRWHFSWTNNWPDLNPSHRFNWREFTLVKLAGEIEHMTGRAELEVVVLGLGVTVTYIYDHTFNDKMLSKKDEILAHFEAEMPGAKVYDPQGILDKLPGDDHG